MSVPSNNFQVNIFGNDNSNQNPHHLKGLLADADYYIPGFNRGELTIEFLRSWIAAKIPDADILKIMTTNGYEISGLEDERGPVKVGFAADIIATAQNPLDDINALRDVQFVMKDGNVFKRGGVVSSLDFFNNGPVYGWRKR